MSGCYGMDHDLEVIDSRQSEVPGVKTVVRWCRRCGGCAVDIDSNGKTRPGLKMPMKFPTLDPFPAFQDSSIERPRNPVRWTDGPARVTDVAALSRPAIGRLVRAMAEDPLYFWEWHRKVETAALRSGVSPTMARETATAFMWSRFDIRVADSTRAGCYT